MSNKTHKFTIPEKIAQAAEVIITVIARANGSYDVRAVKIPGQSFKFSPSTSNADVYVNCTYSKYITPADVYVNCTYSKYITPGICTFYFEEDLAKCIVLFLFNGPA